MRESGESVRLGENERKASGSGFEHKSNQVLLVRSEDLGSMVASPPGLTTTRLKHALKFYCAHANTFPALGEPWFNVPRFVTIRLVIIRLIVKVRWL